MAYDIAIRGGLLVDGTGSEPVYGDLGIANGVITAVGKLDGKARREVDARGLTVTPGFVDIHTHLDAQIGWDPDCTPVSWHGVTTALLGNCGVTFAPCRPADKELLAGMMETVEDIPRHAILSGLPWSWEDYGGYLDAIEALKPGINIAGLVGHSAVRFYVMGERAVEEQASDEERRQMADVVARSIDRGAVGFSTNRFAPHKLPDGRSIPGTFADPQELVEIAKVVAPRGGLMQAVGADNAVLRTIADAAHGRVLFSYGSGGGDLELAKQRRDALETLCAGRDMTAITQVRASGMIYGLQAGLPVRGAAWSRLRRLPTLADRVAALGDGEFHAQLIAEAKANGFKQNLGTPVEKVFYLGDGPTPAYTAGEEMSLVAMAQARGEHWAETFLRLGRETHGKALFTLRMFNSNLDALAHMFKSERCFPSLGDAGAHVTQVMDAGWATFILAYWVRETGFFTLQDAVRRMTAVPARVMGLKDRGTLKVGQRADVNVFDAATVSERQPELVNDFPGGAARFIQRSTGYKATIVNGAVNVLDGELTGTRAGRVLRHAA
ncbi:MAG: amidohydrolase family protein [Alphaproteobacteria bacterium]|nr:amidohydrolase family protein [Alphaproteobacteria bacterium]